VFYRRYTPSLADTDKIIVDGNECGKGLQLSHWPGNSTPAHLRADLSVEIVMRFAADPHRSSLADGRQIVTNDHYDTDGVLAAWAALHPDDALDHAKTLLATAETGDFYEFTTPAALKTDLTIQAFADRQRSPLAPYFAGRTDVETEQQATDVVLAELPGLLYDTGRYRHLWEDEYGQIVERLSELNEGSIEAREYPTAQLTVLRTQKPLDHFSRNAFSHGHRILEVRRNGSGTFYSLYYREFLWYDIISRTTSPLHRFVYLADQLNDLEPAASAGSWVITEWTPALLFAAHGDRSTRVVTHKEPAGQSALDPTVVEQCVVQELQHLDWEHEAAQTARTAPQSPSQA
jgi:hypothetical protein